MGAGVYEPVEILLVEDNPQDAEITLRALKRANFANHVQWLKDGEEALEFLFSQGQYEDLPQPRPRVMLLDIKMPKVDGLEVLRIIKGDSNLRTIPVVVLTSSREERDLVEGYKLGVNAYVVKPVEFSQFMDSVKQLGAFWALVNEPPVGSIPLS